MANEMLVEIGDRPASSAALNPRHDQTFPQLTSTEIGRLRRFGQQKSYKSGETLFNTGDHGPGMFIVLSGHVTITQRDGLGHISPVADQGPGHFVAEVGTLANGPALVDAHADGDVEAIQSVAKNCARF